MDIENTARIDNFIGVIFFGEECAIMETPINWSRLGAIFKLRGHNNDCEVTFLYHKNAKDMGKCSDVDYFLIRSFKTDTRQYIDAIPFQIRLDNSGDEKQLKFPKSSFRISKHQLKRAPNIQALLLSVALVDEVANLLTSIKISIFLRILDVFHSPKSQNQK